MPPRKRAEPTPGRHSTDTPREGGFVPPVRPSTARANSNRRDSAPRHLGPDAPTKAPPKKKAAKAAPASAPPAPTRPSGAGRHERVGAAARDYADRSAWRATHKRPSVVGRSAAGGAAGAAAGSVFGPVGTGVGAAAGAVGGAVGGHSAKKAYNKAMSAGNGNARRIIVAEFAVCMVIVALSPLTKTDERPGAWMKRMTAVMGMFLVLAFLSAGGRGVARAAAGFGGIVTLTLALSDRDLFVKLAQVFNSTNDKVAPGSRTGEVTPSPATPPDVLGGGNRADREAQLRYGATG